MRPSQITGIALGAFFTVSATAFAQTPPTQPPPTQTPPPQTEPAQNRSAQPAPTQTFAGCLMTERDYRAAHNLGDGQIGGVGLGDEFVLVDVKTSPAKASSSTTTTDRPAASASASTAAPAKCDDKGTAYRLTGSDEEQLKTLVGRHVEIQGRFKNAGDAAGSGARPEGTLPAEVEIVSFAEAAAPESAMAPVTAPATAQTTPPASPPVTPPATQTAPPPPPPAPVAQPPATPPQTPAAAERRELPATAGPTALLALIGVIALGSGFVMSRMRRRSLQ